MRHLDLFSGIGGFALAARWMGWQTVGFCEIEDFPRKILAKNFPGIPIFDDVRTLDADRLAGLGRIDIVTGGFPCQDVSTAGKRAGIAGARSGLWAEMFRIIQSAQPAWVVAENVPGLRTIGADRVLADLAEAGYTAWPLVVGAVHAGAPHRRQRVWIVANSDVRRCDRRAEQDLGPQARLAAPRWHDLERLGADAADAAEHRRREGRAESARIEGRHGAVDGSNADAADATSIRRDGSAAVAGSIGESQTERRLQEPARGSHYQPDWRGWTDAPQPAVRAVDDGLPAWVAGCRVPALKALGNAIVPQVAYYLFRAIEDAVNGHH